MTAFTPVVFLPTSCIASANFSQTRGTAKNTVGLAAMSVCLSEPFKASGRAKCTSAGSPIRSPPMGEWMSTTCAAMCDKGR